MTIQPVRYVTKPVFVEAVQVTEENMEAVAEWCGGEVEIQTLMQMAPGDPPEERYVVLYSPRRKARVGDYVFGGGRHFTAMSRAPFEAGHMVATDREDGR